MGFSRQEYWSGVPLLLLFSHEVMLDSSATSRTVICQVPLSIGFPTQETGSHFLFQCMKVKSESEVAQSCPTLSDPMDCSLLGSSAHGIFQARVLEWGAIAFSDIYLLIFQFIGQ